ncbi:carbonic anhydrase 1-like [Dendronephthya gigantea]|uniref:carbonic anhydrase 1-like n=1 Tax=Dendronephthya gigantea TaxID=151771 RepID=UPI00106A2689|nr:carbonic anhydrase 1-like [Dendronephthya gigantea]
MFQQLSGFLFFVLVGYTAAAGDTKWDHTSVKYGVYTWAKHFPQCNGTRQSPIDIKDPTYNKDLGNIAFQNYGAIPSNVNVIAKNTGHSYSVSFTGFTASNTPKISAGGLPGEFKLAAFHFHWGSNHTLGSEHFVNGKSYPSELHLVHLNSKYASVSVGLTKSDGLAVLGVLLKQGKRNSNFDFLHHEKNNVTEPNSEAKFNLTSLMGLLPVDKSFYRYNGSLTTPGCQEVVTWTVFSHPVEIAHEQLEELRNVKFVDPMNMTKPLVNNHRPIQALNARMVLSNFDETASKTNPTMSTTTAGAASGMNENMFIFLASLCLALCLFL